MLLKNHGPTSVWKIKDLLIILRVICSQKTHFSFSRINLIYSFLSIVLWSHWRSRNVKILLNSCRVFLFSSSFVHLLLLLLKFFSSYLNVLQNGVNDNLITPFCKLSILAIRISTSVFKLQFTPRCSPPFNFKPFVMHHVLAFISLFIFFLWIVISN